MVKLWRIGLLSLFLIGVFVGLWAWGLKQPQQLTVADIQADIIVGNWERTKNYPFPPGGAYGITIRFYADGTYQVRCLDGDVFLPSVGTWIITEDSSGQLHLDLDQKNESSLCSLAAYDNQVVYLEMSGQLVLAGQNDAKLYLRHRK